MALDESRSKRTNPKARMPRRTSGFTILLVVLAVCVLAILGYLLWPSQEAAVTPTPSPPPVAASPSPNLPTSEQDIAAAKEAYADYHEAYWDIATDGKQRKFLERVKPFVTGEALEYSKKDARENRKNDYTFKGETPNAIVTRAVRRDSRTVELSVCLDLREMTATRPNGDKVDIPVWGTSKTRMNLVGDTWKIADRDDKIENKPCT